jgi:hypothetical protein
MARTKQQKRMKQKKKVVARAKLRQRKSRPSKPKTGGDCDGGDSARNDLIAEHNARIDRYRCSSDDNKYCPNIFFDLP